MHASSRTLSRHLALGFTLIEVMIVVAIIAILASVAYPSYTDYVIRGRIPDATSSLSAWQIKMEQYFQDNRNYGIAGGACGVTNPNNTTDFNYSCVNPTTATFTLTATGAPASTMGGFVFTINENGDRTSKFPAKWGNGSYSCWVTKKGGSC
jgi:type IV pilus assembly protein PilE